MSTSPSESSRLGTWKRPAALLLGLVGLLLIGRMAPVGAWLVSGSAYLRHGGALGAALFILAYSAGAFLFVPSAMFTFVAGFTYGAWWGALIAVPGIGSSSFLVFLLSRSVLRRQVERWLANDPRFKTLDLLLGKLGARAVVLLRLSPLSPFNVLNFAFGLTSMRRRDYLVATCIGTIPGSVFYAQLGAIAPSLARISEGRLPDTGRAQSGMLLVGLLVTGVVAVWLGRVAKRALAAAQLPPTKEPSPTLAAQDPEALEH